MNLSFFQYKKGDNDIYSSVVLLKIKWDKVRDAD